MTGSHIVMSLLGLAVTYDHYKKQGASERAKKINYGLKPDLYSCLITTGLSPWLLIINKLGTLVPEIKDLNTLKNNVYRYTIELLFMRFSLKVKLELIE
jgi:hypothetical protein